MKEFKVGDRARIVKNTGCSCLGAAIGVVDTIKAIDRTGHNTWYAVEFDVSRKEYGSCNGICEKRKVCGVWPAVLNIMQMMALRKKENENAIVLKIKRLADAGWKTEDIVNEVVENLVKTTERYINAHKEASKSQLRVGDYVKVINTGMMYSTNTKKVIELSNGMDERDNIIARYAYGYSPCAEGKEDLKERYKILTMDNNHVLIENAETFAELKRVLLIDKEGLERWQQDLV